MAGKAKEAAGQAAPACPESGKPQVTAPAGTPESVRGVTAGTRDATQKPSQGKAIAPEPKATATADPESEFLRAPNEDDDGYDPYSDRRPAPEPLFEPDPWD